MVALNTAYAAPKNAADPKNRVGDFFYEDHASVGKNRWASRLNTQEKSCYHYETASGRSNWPNRDPKGRRGGLNLYGMVENNPIGVWDLLGLQGCKPCKNKKDGKPGEFSESGRHLLNAFYFLAGHPARFGEMKCKCNGEMICPRKPCKRKCKVTVLTETTSTGDWGDALNDRFAQIPAGEPGHGLNVDTATANMINDNFDQIKQDAVDDFKKRCNDACK